MAWPMLPDSQVLEELERSWWLQVQLEEPAGATSLLKSWRSLRGARASEGAQEDPPRSWRVLDQLEEPSGAGDFPPEVLEELKRI